MRNLNRLGQCTPEEFFSVFTPKHAELKKDKAKFFEKKPRFKLKGFSLKLRSLRYRTFMEKGIKCCKCGIEGKFFAFESIEGQNPHANLYAVSNGEEIMMTKDHILPSSRGGNNHPHNLQTMCEKCNSKKGNKIQ